MWARVAYPIYLVPLLFFVPRKQRTFTIFDLRHAIIEGTLERVRPKMMTVVASLTPRPSTPSAR
jgi:Cu/Ag efflux pump CusA